MLHLDLLFTLLITVFAFSYAAMQRKAIFLATLIVTQLLLRSFFGSALIFFGPFQASLGSVLTSVLAPTVWVFIQRGNGQALKDLVKISMFAICLLLFQTLMIRWRIVLEVNEYNRAIALITERAWSVAVASIFSFTAMAAMVIGVSNGLEAKFGERIQLWQNYLLSIFCGQLVGVSVFVGVGLNYLPAGELFLAMLIAFIIQYSVVLLLAPVSIGSVMRGRAKKRGINI